MLGDYIGTNFKCWGLKFSNVYFGDKNDEIHILGTKKVNEPIRCDRGKELVYKGSRSGFCSPDDDRRKKFKKSEESVKQRDSSGREKQDPVAYCFVLKRRWMLVL